MGTAETSRSEDDTIVRLANLSMRGALATDWLYFVTLLPSPPTVEAPIPATTTL